MLLKNGKILEGLEFVKKNILINDDRIENVGYELDGEGINLNGCYVVPGYIDIHTHGAFGHDINTSNVKDLNEISKYFSTNGVTGFLASILTDTREQTLWCIDQINEAMDKGLEGARLLGIHLEGPFLSKKFKGAMPEALLKNSDIELLKEYQERARGRVKYITIAPEILPDMALIKEMKKLGIVVAMGHSDATYDEAVSAIENGVTSTTHIFNAMRPIHHHEIGIAGAALMSDIYSEVICDGLHLIPHTVKFIANNKGLDKMIAITDCIMATGLGDGEYKLGVNDIVVKNGDARLKYDDVRAGSTLRMCNAVKNVAKFLHLPLEKVQRIASKNPAKLLGINDCGEILSNNRADITILDDRLEVIMTIVGGKIVYQKEGILI